MHGAREAVESILEHPLVKGVSFVGSTPVARLVYERGTAAGKRVQANGGAKNRMVIMPDADPAFATSAVQAVSRCLQDVQASVQERLAEITLADLVKQTRPVSELSFQI